MIFKIDNRPIEGELTFTIYEEPVNTYDEKTQSEIQQMQTVVYGTLLLPEFITDIHFIKSDTFRFDKIHINRITIGTKDTGIVYEFSCQDFRVDNEKIQHMLENNKTEKRDNV